MTSIIKLTPLSGDQDTSPPCYLLQIDQFKCLLDCGWDEHFSQNIVTEIEKNFTSLDAILLTYPDPQHLGALPYLIKKHGLSCPIYATRPVRDMGKMFMTDLVLSRLNGEDFELFTIDDVNNAFEKITHLAYNQPFTLENKGNGLTITPLPAGHMVGGTVWKIIKDNEEDIVYAVDYNHKKERHLNGCAIELVTRPSLLITDSYNAYNNQVKMQERDNEFLNTISETLKIGGNVLLACDTAGRILELAFMLDRLWGKKELGVGAYSLALVSNVSNKMIDITKSTIEWMSDAILRDFDSSRDNPFTFKYLQLKQRLHSKDNSKKEEALSSLPQGIPMTVIATQPDLECGFSRDLFTLWCEDDRNCIIFTQRPGIGTLGHQIFKWANKPVDEAPRPLDLEIRQRFDLEGLELEEYYKKKEAEKTRELHEKMEDSHESEDAESSHGDEEAIEELAQMNKSLTISSKINKHDLMIREGKLKGPVFFKQARKSFLMFPAPKELKVRWDEYGEIINTEEYALFHQQSGPNKVLEADEDKENEKLSKVEQEISTQEKPTKCLAIRHTMNVKAKIRYFDFEGRSDGRSVKNLISQIKPRRMVLVRGSPEASAHIAKHCRSHVDDKIFIARLGETIDATTENHIYQVKLKDSLVSSLTFVKTEDCAEIAWVDATTVIPETDEFSTDNLPCLDVVPPEEVPLHKAIYVNELKLSDFKQILLTNGIQAEFSGGVLFCNDTVSVKRVETGRIHVEGILCPDYFKIRDLLYKQYVVI